jgi:hypothetical protein
MSSQFEGVCDHPRNTGRARVTLPHYYWDVVCFGPGKQAIAQCCRFSERMDPAGTDFLRAIPPLG